MRVWAAALLGVLAVAAVLRATHLTADPPTGFAPGSLAEYTDEGFKTYHARNRVLFGTWLAHPDDGYRYWLRRSPLAVGLHAAWFAARGRIDIRSARELHVAVGLLTLALWGLAVWRELGPPTALVSTGLLASSSVATVYGRMVFLENLLALAAVTVAWLLCRPRAGWLARGAAAVVAASTLLVKPSALLFLVAGGGGLLLVALRRAHEDASRQAPVSRWLAFMALAGLGLYLLLWRFPSLGPALLPLARGDGVAAPGELARGLLLTQFGAKDPFLWVLGLWGAGLTLATALSPSRQPVPRLPLVSAGAFLLGVLGLAMVEGDADRIRYYVVLLPPLALLAALTVTRLASATDVEREPYGWAAKLLLAGVAGMAVTHLGYAVVLPWLNEPLRSILVATLRAVRGATSLPSTAPWLGPLVIGSAAVGLLLALATLLRRRGHGPVLARALAAGSLATGVVSTGVWLGQPTFAMQAARQDLAARLPDSAFVAGSWAPSLALGTPLRALRSGPEVNVRDGRLRHIRPSHLLLSDDRPEDRASVESACPGVLGPGLPLAVYDVDRFAVRLYPLDWASTGVRP